MFSLKNWIVIFATLCLLVGAQVNALPIPWRWTGYYLGLNVGLASCSDSIHLKPRGAWRNESQTLQDNIRGSGSTNLGDSHVTIGGQIGYNYQYCGLLVGIEADANYVHLRDVRHTGFRSFAVGLPQFAFNDHVNHHWLVTIRPRIGGIFCHHLLYYVTGGFAAGDVHVRSRIIGNSGYHSFASGSARLTGWTTGLGLEYAIKPCLSVKAEYLYISLGTFNTTSTPQNVASAGYFETRRYRVCENNFRLGVNYRL